jgi:hypothetical protein
LYYGNARVLAPDYDIDLVAGEMLNAQKSDCRLGTQEDLRAASWGSDASAGKVQLVFWLGLGLAVVLLLWVLSRLLPEHTTGSG